MAAGGALTLVLLYEAPHRILETLADVEQVWSAHVRVVVGREVTKLHEEFLRGTVAEVRAQLGIAGTGPGRNRAAHPGGARGRAARRGESWRSVA